MSFIEKENKGKIGKKDTKDYTKKEISLNKKRNKEKNKIFDQVSEINKIKKIEDYSTTFGKKYKFLSFKKLKI